MLTLSLPLPAFTTTTASVFTAQSAGGNNTTAVVALQLLGGSKSDWKPVEIDSELTEQAAAAKAVSAGSYEGLASAASFF